MDRTFFCPKISSMTQDQHETAAALVLLDLAGTLTLAYTKHADRAAATSAVLARALELATPDLTGELRGSLFTEDE